MKTATTSNVAVALIHNIPHFHSKKEQLTPSSEEVSCLFSVETRGLEPLTPALQRQCSPN